MAVGANNPRLFAETVSLDAWRSPFDAKINEADLYIDVVFSARGRVGGGDAPVRFRLSLRRAEVHVIRDVGGVIEIKKKSVLRRDPEISKEHITSERTTSLSGDASAGLSLKSRVLELAGKINSSLKVVRKSEQSVDLAVMMYTHQHTKHGYAFKVEATSSRNRLEGQPWPASSSVLKIIDKNPKRKRGEPPEVRIEVQCLREDFIIEDIQFTSSSIPAWVNLPRKKQIAVEQYIKNELFRHGLACEELSNPFARIVLGDATPVVEE